MDRREMCRLCAEHRPNQQLTSLYDPSQDILIKLFRCSQIDLSLEKNILLPQGVCGDCIKRLERCCCFAEAVAKAQKKLQLEFVEDPLANIKEEYISDENYRVLDNFGGEVKTGIGSYAGNTVPTIGSKTHEFSKNICGAKDKRFATCRGSKELWLEVIKQFRQAFNIIDKDCNEDGTISEEAHPELSKYSWRSYKWICSICKNFFENVDTLKTHVETQHNTKSSEMDYCCIDCDNKYVCLASLKTHIFSEHRALLKFNCDHCGIFYWCIDSLTTHRNNLAKEKERSLQRMDRAQPCTTIRRFKCDICGVEMNSKNNIQIHMRRTHSSNGIVCEYCDEDFSTQYEKKLHLFKAHSELYPICCDICDERFKEATAFKKHKRNFHNYFVQQPVPVAVDSDILTPNSCTICQIVLSDVHELNEHMKKHSNTCTICGKRFSSTPILQRHLRDHSEAVIIIPKQCKFCEVPLPDPKQFHDHMKTHVDGNTFKCHICGKTNNKARIHKVHLKTHAKPPVSKRCKICDTILLSSTDIDEHMKTHMDGNDFKCNICEYRTNKKYFRLRLHLKAHSRVNTVTCKICGKELTSKSSLQDHMRTHTKEMPFVCEFCGKKFGRRQNLKVHRLVHTGVRPYSCTICVPNHHFARRGNYCVHMTRYHGIDARVRPTIPPDSK